MADNDDYMAAKSAGDTITETMWDQLQENINANRRFRIKGISGGDNIRYTGSGITWDAAIYIYFTRESDGAWVYNTIAAGSLTLASSDAVAYIILNDTTGSTLTMSGAAYGSLPTDDTGRMLILGATKSSKFYAIWNIIGDAGSGTANYLAYWTTALKLASMSAEFSPTTGAVTWRSLLSDYVHTFEGHSADNAYWRFNTTIGGASGYSFFLGLNYQGIFRIVKTGISSVDGISIGQDGKVTLTSGVGINEFSSDTTLAGNSDDAVPTEKAVKTYVDARAGESSGTLHMGANMFVPNSASFGYATDGHNGIIGTTGTAIYQGGIPLPWKKVIGGVTKYLRVTSLKVYWYQGESGSLLDQFQLYKRQESPDSSPTALIDDATDRGSGTGYQNYTWTGTYTLDSSYCVFGVSIWRKAVTSEANFRLCGVTIEYTYV